MAFVQIDPTSGNVVAVFANPQPALAGYQQIDDTDARVAAYNAVQAAVATNAPILAQIAAIEARQARALRENAIGTQPASGQPTALARLQQYDAQVAALRATLQAG